MGILDKAKDAAKNAAEGAKDKIASDMADKKERKAWEKSHKVVATLKCGKETMNLREGFIEYIGEDKGTGGIKPLGEVKEIRIETGEELTSRVTVSRVVLIGLFALAAKKKEGGEKYLTIGGDDFIWAMEVPRKMAKDAQKFLVRVDNAIRSSKDS